MLLLSDMSRDLLSQIEELSVKKQVIDGAVAALTDIVAIAKAVSSTLAEDLKAAFLEEAIARLQSLKDGDNSIQISISPVPSLGILSCSQLEERLGVGVRGQVNKKDGNFGEWSKAKDPDGLEWRLFRYHGTERPAYEFAAVDDSAACAELEKRQKERAYKHALSIVEEETIQLIASNLFLTSPANLTSVEWNTVIEAAMKQLAKFGGNNLILEEYDDLVSHIQEQLSVSRDEADVWIEGTLIRDWNVPYGALSDTDRQAFAATVKKEVQEEYLELAEEKKEKAWAIALLYEEAPMTHIQQLAAQQFSKNAQQLTLQEWDAIINHLDAHKPVDDAIAENPGSKEDDYNTLEEAQDFATELASEYNDNPEEHLETLANELFDIPFNYLSLQQTKQLINRCKDDIDKLKEQGALLLNTVKENDEELEEAAF